jgi:hypothetical protein
LIHESDTYLGCQVDHVIAEKHGGLTGPDNLAFACTFCNRSKGTDIGSILPGTEEFIRFFNPRVDEWSEHFRLDRIQISPLTPIGNVTERILRFNQSERKLERDVLGQNGRYPSDAALKRL